MTQANPIIRISNLRIFLGNAWVHDGLNLAVEKGEILAIVGGSGSGKTTLLREMLGLTPPTSGSIEIFNRELTNASPATLLEIQKRWGVLFQSNALFSSLTILENVAFPLKEHTTLDSASINELALLKIKLAGLPEEAAIKYPSQLSGGMLRRAGLARAIVLDPELIFLDEPTSGLDPNTAAAFDELILNLQSTMGLTIVIITHDLDSLWTIADRVAFLGKGKVLSVDTMPNLVKNSNPMIQAFFNGPRGRMAQENHESRQ